MPGIHHRIQLHGLLSRLAGGNDFSTASVRSGLTTQSPRQALLGLMEKMGVTGIE
jgi:hypothetical protein